MGCDIHTRIEYLNRKEDWVSGDFFRLNPYYSGDNPEETEPFTVVEVCGDRNYDLFAVLADVRNYDHNAYIDVPRGIPDDACARTRRAYEAWGSDAHSASWFTLRELMDWNKKHGSQKLKCSGMVSAETAAKMDADPTYQPDTWCGWTSATGWVHREWERDYNPLDHLIEELIRRGEELWLWYGDEALRKNADRLRFIFWFDN